MLDDKEPNNVKEPLLFPQSQLAMSFADLKKLKLDALSNVQVMAYGVGHFLNDIVAALWFNFLLFFLVEVEPIIQGDTRRAGGLVGLVFLIGQVVDGLATPVVGVVSDNLDTRCGKRMPWYYVGMLMTGGTFIFMFQPCVFCRFFENSEMWAFTNYAFFGAVVNIGWAMCQVSHMSLVPSISLSRLRRDMLNNLRGNFTFLANLGVLMLAALFFAIIPGAAFKYQLLCFVSVGCGFACSIFFVYNIREKPLTIACRKLAKEYKHMYSKLSTMSSPETYEGSFMVGGSNDAATQEEAATLNAKEVGKEDEENRKERLQSTTSATTVSDFRWYHWLKSGQFWLYGGVYMAARIFQNVPASMLLFYLKYSLLFSSEQDKSKETETPFSFALVLMLVYLSCSLTTTQLTKFYVAMGRKRIFSISAVIAIVTCFALMFLPSEFNFAIYGIVIALGFSQSIILNTSIAYISEVVGMNGANGAFVYGTYSLFEKVANGVLLFFILESKDIKDAGSNEYLRICISIIPGLAVVFGWICILVGKAADYQKQDDDSGNSDALINVEGGGYSGAH